MKRGGGTPPPTTIPGVELTEEMLDAPEPAALVERLATAEQDLDLSTLDPDKAGVTEGVVNGERVKVVTGTPPPVRRRQGLAGMSTPGYTPPPRRDPRAPPVRTPPPAPERTPPGPGLRPEGDVFEDEFDLVGPTPPPPPLTPASTTRIGRPPESTEPPPFRDDGAEDRPPTSQRSRAGLWMGVGLTGLLAAIALLILTLVVLGAVIFGFARMRAEPAPAPTIPVPVMIHSLPEEAPPAAPEPEDPEYSQGNVE